VRRSSFRLWKSSPCSKNGTTFLGSSFVFTRHLLLRNISLARSRFVVVSLSIAFSLTIGRGGPRLNAQTAEPWAGAHFSGDPKAIYEAASAITTPIGTDALVLDERERYSFDNDGKQVYTHYLIYKIFTSKGAEQWDSVMVHWEPWHDERPTIQARVITKDCDVHTLDSKAITDSPAHQEENESYGDQRVLRAPLPAIAPGVVVEEERTVRETAPFYSAGVVARAYVGRGVPVRHMLVELEAPASLPLQYETRLIGEAGKPHRTEANGKVTLTFEFGPLEALENSAGFLPSDVPAFPSITFSTGKSWNQIAAEYSGIVEKQIAGANVKALVTRLITGQTTRDEKVAAILDYLNHEVRYTGVEFGENNIVPHSPTETLKQKYGDCKDKSSLLVTMLRAAGIPAYVALLDAGFGEDLSPTLPGMGMFDHAIVYVPGSPDLWIDTTDEYARLGQMPNADQGRLALVAKPETQELIKTPVATSSENLVVEKREFYLAENGPARVVEITEPRGSFESQYRSYYADKDNDERRKGLTEYVQVQYLAEKLDRVERSDPGDFSKPFELTLETLKARRGYTDLQSAVAAIRLESLFDRLPEQLRQREPEEDKNAEPESKPKRRRTADYQLQAAFATEWQYTIVPPPGFRPKPLPQNVKMNAGPAVLTEEFSADANGTVHARLRFDTVKSRLTVAEATELRNQVAEWRLGEATLIQFEPTAQALVREGKMREGFQAYRELIALHPKEAVHHLQIADALLQAGMGEAAREEAHKAVKLEPQSSLAQKTLAQVLEYDVVGRKFRAGSDYAGAEAAFRAAEQLDRDDHAVTGDLAILLEYNHEGQRYGVGAPLREAATVYRRMNADQLAKLGLKNNLAFALFYAGEFAEAEKEGKALNPQLNALIVACEAAQNGAAAGLAEANRRTSNDEDRKQMLRTAGEMLMNARSYPAAAGLMEAGASGDQATRTATIAGALRKARRHEEIVPTDDPAGVAMRSILMLADLPMSKEKMVELSSRNARKVMNQMDPDEMKKVLDAGRSFRSSMARIGSSPDVALDIVLQLMEMKTEGNDASGYRVHVKMVGGKNLTLFVVKEDGRYKVLDSSEKPNAIGLEALDRVNAGNLDGARVLLDWIRDDQHLEGGDDPLAGLAFPRLWTKGKEADGAAMKVAAAGLLAQTAPTAKEGVALLEAMQAQATGDAAKLNIELALAEGYEVLEQYDKLLAVSMELRKQYPESRQVFLMQSWALRGLRKYEDEDRLAHDRLKRLPDDVDAMRALALSAVAREDYRLAYERAKEVVKLEKSEASDKNAMAWYALFTGKVSGEDTETALAAAQANQNNANVLHTLGCVYAEMGKTKEAREVFVQAMNVGNLDEPDDAFWYGLGRLAEQYGETDVAREDYQRVNRPHKAAQIPSSSYRLAQIRMKAMARTSDTNVAGK
jgi:Tfp pilus assembly protein PilF